MQFRILTAPLVAAAALIAPALSQAQQAPLPPGSLVVSPMMGFAFTASTGGNNKLATLVYTDGTTSSVHAGGLGYLYGGAELHPVGAPFALRGTVGFHWDTTGANNGNATFSRIPVEVVGMFEPIERIRFGAGVRYDSSVHMSASGAANGAGMHQGFESAAGVVVKVEYRTFREVGIELGYTDIHYKLNELDGVAISGGPSVNGSNVSLGFNYHW
jgi:hypothetical protein